MTPFADINYLRSSGYSIKMPFRFQLDSEGEKIELVCTHATRILPGKRLVCFGDLNTQPVVVKFFLDPGGAKRHFFRELRGVKAFQDAGIKTPELIFANKPESGSPYVLCFRRVMPAKDLFDVWESLKNDEQRIRILSRAVAVIAAQHAQGLKQNDLHRENFLLSGEDVYSIDGDAVDARQLGTPLSKKKSLKNLGMFFTHLYPQHEPIISDVFKVYAEHRGWELSDPLMKQLMEEIRRKKNRRKKEYLKKIYRECTDFVCKRNWNRYMVCAREAYTEKMARLLDHPDHYMDSGELLKAGNTATLARVRVEGRDVVIKRYNIKSFFHGLGRFYRPSRAWVSWRNSHLLRYMNVYTPMPIAFIERRWGPFRKSAYFITEYVPGVSLNHVFDAKRVNGFDMDDIVEQTGALIQTLFDLMIGHGDFKASNFIVTKDGISIIDLDVMRQYKSRWKFCRAFKRDSKRFMKNWSDRPEIEHSFQKMISTISH